MTTERRERGFLTLTIDGATEYFSTVQDVGNRRCSTPVKLCGVEWTMEVYRSGSYLAAAIRYAGSVPFQDDPCFTVNPVVRVRSSTSEDAIRHFDTKISKGFTSGSTGIFVYLGVSQSLFQTLHYHIISITYHWRRDRPKVIDFACTFIGLTKQSRKFLADDLKASLDVTCCRF